MKKKENTNYLTYFNKVSILTKILVALIMTIGVQVSATGNMPGTTTVLQQKEISGTVKDESGTPLIGVNVYIKGTTTGAITDVNGKFQLSVTSNSDIIVFSSIGMETKEVVVGDQTEFTIVLKTSDMELGDVVVVAYGTKRKGAITGSVDVIDAKELDQTTATSFDQALQGKATGMQVIQNNGMPGSKAEIKIRGTGSIGANAEPLFVIDGIPTNASSFSELNANDIESLSVLKDASAASLYGSRAANGVVLITTKKGKAGKTNFTFRATNGVAVKTADKFRMMNAQELLDYEVLIGRRAAFDPNDPDIQQLLANDHSWLNDIFRTANTSSYELSASGGSEKTTFYTSLSSFSQEGIITGTGMDRYTMRLNLNHNISNNLSLGTNITLGKSHINTASTQVNGTNPMISAYMNRPYHPVKAPDGTWGDTHWSGNWNYFEMEENITQYDDNYKLLGNVFLEYEPIEGLKLKQAFGLDFSQFEQYYFRQPDQRDVVENGATSYMTNSTSKMNTTVSTTTASYGKRLAENHNFNILLGFETNKSFQKGFNARGNTFPSDLTTTLDASAEPSSVGGSSTGWSLISYFGSLHYDLNTKYIVDLSLRRDGSSKFGQNNRYGNFYSVGLGWNIHSESFMSGLDFINILRLRGSFGTSGNFNIGDFAHLGLYSFNSYNQRNISYPYQLGNDNLTWEKNQIASIGLDFAFFEKRLTGAVEYYNRETKDLLWNVNLSHTSGFGSQIANVGSVRNEGIELSLEGDVVKAQEFIYTIGVSFSANKNKVLKLYNDEDIIGDLSVLREGAPINSYYLVRYAGVNPSNGEPLFYDKEGNVTSDYSGDDRVLLDKTLDPDYFGSITNNISYKGFNLSANFYYSIGNYVYNGLLIVINGDGQEGGNQTANALYDSWKKPGDITEIPKQDQNIPRADRSTRELEDASFIRLKDVSLSYTLPGKWVEKVKLDRVRLYARGMNLWTYTKFSGIDPEMKYGFWKFDYPPARTFTFGIDIKF